MKTKRKAKLNWLSLTGLASFFLHEYQHVHLLRFKKQSFTLVGKPNPPLCYIRYTQLHARADAVCINQTLPMKRSCWRAFVRAKPGSTEALAWKRISSRDQWNLTSATIYRGLLYSLVLALEHTLYEADALEQRRPCTRTSVNMLNFLLAHSKKNGRKWDHFGRSLEPCSGKMLLSLLQRKSIFEIKVGGFFLLRNVHRHKG